MFDLAFSELLVIGVVALIVIGPERLPRLARTAGAWLGRLNRYVSQVKQDVERDIKIEELRQLQKEMKESAQKYEILAEKAEKTVRREMGHAQKVAAAMSVTDGGLSQKLYDEIQTEKEAGQPSAEPAGSPDQPETAPVLTESRTDEASLAPQAEAPPAAQAQTEGPAESPLAPAAPDRKPEAA